MSAQNSNHSTDSLESIDHNQQQNDPQAYNPLNQINEDAQSELSTINTNISRQQSLRIVPTETAKSLADVGVSSTIPVPDIVHPTQVQNPMFPEEYTLETETGLVPVSTLHSLGRIPSQTSKSKTAHLKRKNSNESESLSSSNEKPEPQPETPEDLEHANVEFVTFVIDDPENPHNWSEFTRWSYTLILSSLVICVAYGSSCISGGLGTVTAKFDVSMEVAILTCSLMVLGFAVGPLVWSPLSEQIGRRPVYFISFFVYVIFNIPCARAPNIGTLLVCRFICGVFASSGLSLVGGSIADMFPQTTRGFGIAFFAFAPYSGPVLGVIVNGFIANSTKRMDVIFWVNFAFAGLMWIVVAFIPETYAPVILKRKAARMRKETGNPNIMTEQELNKLSLKELIETCLYRPLKFIAQEMVLDLMCFYVCLIYALLYAFFFAYPVIFAELYDYKDNIVGLMFVPILIGALFALCATGLCELSYMKMTKTRKATPEDRLVGAMIGAPFPAIALWILGATSYKHIIWVGPASSGLAFGFGMVLIYYSINNYIIDTYAKYAASALASKVFLRSAGGAAFPLFTQQMYHKLGLQWASWLLAFISTAMILIPFTFYKFGGQLRKKLCREDYSGET